MACAACNKVSNYVFCEECLAWLLESETSVVSLEMEDPGEEASPE